MRLYSFVANLYLSPLQHGLQTAHAVSQMHVDHDPGKLGAAFNMWARDHKTIIICGAVNSAGVLAAWERLKYFQQELGVPCTIFREDKESLNGAATAAAIIVPAQYYEAFLEPVIELGVYPGYIWENKEDEQVMDTIRYEADSVEAEFITFLKSYRLA